MSLSYLNSENNINIFVDSIKLTGDTTVPIVPLSTYTKQMYHIPIDTSGCITTLQYQSFTGLTSLPITIEKIGDIVHLSWADWTASPSQNEGQPIYINGGSLPLSYRPFSTNTQATVVMSLEMGGANNTLTPLYCEINDVFRLKFCKATYPSTLATNRQYFIYGGCISYSTSEPAPPAP